MSEKPKTSKKGSLPIFPKKQEYGKTKALVSKIQHIKYVIVTTEMDALLLENNLIKNINLDIMLLKDGKLILGFVLSMSLSLEFS